MKEWMRRGFAMVLLLALMLTSLLPQQFVSADTEDSNKSSSTITEFDDYTNSVTTKKGTLVETLGLLPGSIGFQLEDGSHKTIDANWECSDDYEGTNYSMYTFDLQLPEEYSLGSGLTSWDIPYVNVFIEEDSQSKSEPSTIEEDSNVATQVQRQVKESSAPAKAKVADNRTIEVTVEVDGYNGEFETVYGGKGGEFEIGSPVRMNPCWINNAIEEMFLEHADNAEELVFYANGKEFDWFSTPVSKDTHVVGHWEESKYNVTVVYNNNTYDQETIRVAKGQTTRDARGSIPADPVKSGYEFVQWLDMATGKSFNWNARVNQSRIVVADFELKDAELVVGSENQMPPQTITGNCSIGGYMSGPSQPWGSNTYFQLSGFDGYLAGAAGTGVCVDHGNAAPSYTGATYQATLVSCDMTTGVVIYDVYIFPPNAATGEMRSPNHSRSGYQRCYFQATIHKNFGGYVQVEKVSNCPDISQGNKQYSLSGATYGVYREDGTKVETLVTDASGKTPRSKLLVNGRYYVQEELPPKGFGIEEDEQGNPSPKHYIDVVAGQTLQVSMKDDPINDPFNILLYKTDSENRTHSAKGAASLEGAIFKMEYYDEMLTKEQIKSGDYDPLRTWYFKTVKFGDSDTVGINISLPQCYLADLSDPLYYLNGLVTVPLGTLTVSEETPPKGYKIENSIMFDQQGNAESRDNLVVRHIVTDGITSPIHVYQPFEGTNTIIRGDLRFNKVNEDQERLANIPFRITSNTTGESHVIVSDANGEVDTSADFTPHTKNTNRGRTSEDGIWFYGSMEEDDAISDERGALPYDTYTVEELPCDNNEGMSLVKFEVNISKDKYTVAIGTVTDVFVKLKTTAKDAETLTQQAIADKDVEIIDTVEYEGLVKGNNYKLVATLMDKETGDVVKIDGKNVTATKEFTAEKTKGSVDISLKFDGTEIVGKDVVVFERLYNDEDVLMGSHEDIDDIGQTVKLVNIRIGTQARDEETYTQEAVADEDIKLVDIVEYENLTPGEEFTLEGVLMDKETGEEFKDADGKSVTSSLTFSPKDVKGEETMHFEFDGSNLYNKTIVIFETLKDSKGRVIAEHKDIEDEGQTVKLIPIEIKTTALDKASGTHEIDAKKNAVIVDTVTYKNLTIGKEYNMHGVLMDKETGEPLVDKDGNEITADKKFTPEDNNGTMELEFKFDASALEGTTVVVFETLQRNNKDVAVHADIDDVDQSVNVIAIHTNAVTGESSEEDVDSKIGEDSEGKTSWLDYFKKLANKVTGKEDEEVEYINEGQALDSTTIIDTVSYVGLTPGEEYELSGVVYDKATAQPLIINGVPVSSSVTFTPEEADGEVEVLFTFNAKGLEGKDLVVVEELKREGTKVAEHHDMEDEGQTIHLVDIHTTALGSITKGHEVQASEVTTIIDRVELNNLTIGNEYVVKGVLMDKETKEALKDGDKFVTGETKFVAEEENCTVDIEFTFNSKLLAGTTTVAFESLYRDDILVAVHADYEDEGQTVRIIDIGTKATDAKTGGKTMTLGDSVVLRDTVSYKNLDPEATYTMKGVVMDKSTGMEVIIDGSKVTAETRFKPEKPDGEVVVEFKLSTNKLKGKNLVVFEGLYDGELTKIAEHNDINDQNQTVKVPAPRKLVQTGEQIMIIVGSLACLFAAFVLMATIKRRRRS